MKTTGSIRVYNRYRVFCKTASLKNYIIIYYLSLRLYSLTMNLQQINYA